MRLADIAPDPAESVGPVVAVVVAAVALVIGVVLLVRAIRSRRKG
ncbi:hypothetical protein [Kitasatospora sp. NPDC057015]